jgi:hypothetical protein
VADTHPDVHGADALRQRFERIDVELLNLGTEIDKRGETPEHIEDRALIRRWLTAVPAKECGALHLMEHLDGVYVGERVKAEDGVVQQLSERGAG